MNDKLEIDLLRIRMQRLEGAALAQRFLLELLYKQVFDGNVPGLESTLALVESHIDKPPPAAVAQHEHSAEIAVAAKAHLQRFADTVRRRMGF